MPRRLILFALSALGPYWVTKAVKRWQQPLQQLQFDLASAAAAQTEEDDLSGEKPCLKALVKKELLQRVLPESFTDVVKHFEHFHLALFFLWRRFYEVAKRLCRVVYKDVAG